MSEEIERAREVLEAGRMTPDDLGWIDLGERQMRAVFLLGSVWPELLAVAEAVEAWADYSGPHGGVDARLLATRRTLRAKLREHLGDADG